MESRIYIGLRAELKGKKTLVQSMPERPGKLSVQFDDMSTGLGLGWHEFDEAEF